MSAKFNDVDLADARSRLESVVRSAVWIGLFVFMAGAAFAIYPYFANRSAGNCGKATDLSGMKQLNLGLVMYTGDNDDRYPLATNWMDGVYPYIKAEFIFHSIAAQPDLKPYSLSSKDPYGIALRKSLAATNSSLVTGPAQVASIFDSTNLTRNASGELDLLPDPPRRKEGNAVGFVDGHAAYVPKPVVVVR